MSVEGPRYHYDPDEGETPDAGNSDGDAAQAPEAPEAPGYPPGVEAPGPIWG